MRCSAARRLAQLQFDGELGRFGRWRLARHLAACPGCAAELAQLGAMRDAIAALPREAAPDDLAARIRASIAQEPAPPRPARPRRTVYAWAGPGLAGALAGVALTLLVTRGGDTPDRELIDSHVRSLMAEHLIDVPSSDRHTVKPWLGTHLDASPPVPDLSAEGFELVGGRLDYIEGRPAAAVVYRRGKHVINLFAWASPGAADEAARTSSSQGFNIVAWRQGGLSFRAVSDLEAADLSHFARLVAKSG